jgi:hypothetical protein
MTTEVLSRTMTFLLFAAAGYWLARRMAPPVRLNEWLVWILAVWAAGYLGIHMRLLSISDGLTLPLNNALQGFGVGVLASFLINEYRIHRPGPRAR